MITTVFGSNSAIKRGHMKVRLSQQCGITAKVSFVPFPDLQQLANSNPLMGHMNARYLNLVLQTFGLFPYSTSYEQSKNISLVFQSWNQ